MERFDSKGMHLRQQESHARSVFSRRMMGDQMILNEPRSRWRSEPFRRTQLVVEKGNAEQVDSRLDFASLGSRYGCPGE